MGLVHAAVQLANGEDIVLARRGYIPDEEIRRITADVLVDTGAYTLAINERAREQLGLSPVDEVVTEMADGSRVRLPIVGPIEVRFERRRALVEAVVLPGEQEMLLGAIPMESMDLLVDPKHQRLIVNPDHPNVPELSLKAVR
jgi:clan AA aspartic protease